MEYAILIDSNSCVQSYLAMTYCTNTSCSHPQNPDATKFCSSCGGRLLLKDRYRPVNLIGRGGFGRTFLAVDEYLPSQRECVIKQLCFDSQDEEILQKAVELFRQEAVRLDELGKHPQIPELMAYFEQENRLYLVQELVPGKTLAEEFRATGKFNETQIWELLKELLPILEFIHSRQVIHRDIQPANIIRRSSDEKLVLIDFGVAKLLTGTALLHTGTSVGSAEYIAPEQARGKAVPASDLYSLGVTCIYLLTGVSPFDLFDVANDRWAWRDYLNNGNKVSYLLGQILDKLLHNALSQRYKSATEVLQAITAPPTTITKLPGKRSLVNSLNLEANNTPNPEVEIDYTNLQNLLAAKKWQQADQETWAVMCQALSKPIGSYLYAGDIERLPCAELLTIEALWLKYSKGRFAFSTQKQIYEELDGDYGKFCAAVGWTIHNSSPLSQQLNYSLSAPAGHLPSRIWAGGSQWWRHAAALAEKLASCGMI